MEYRERVADGLIADRLDAMGGVLIEGPRACGKTSTALQHSGSAIRLDARPELAELAALSPSTILAGESPRLIDEWQLAPELWNAVRHEIDARGLRGQFLLSGSARPADDATRHTGAGRIGRVRMRTMSLSESGRSTRQVSLRDLLDGGVAVAGTSPLTYEDVAGEAVRGGWPALLDATTRQSQVFNREYCEELYRSDVVQATGSQRSPDRLRRTLAALARNISTEATLATLAADITADGSSSDPRTVRAYLDAFAQVFALDELPAWTVDLRSRSRLRTMPAIHLADPALACAALGVGQDRLARDPEFFGLVFESMVVRDVRALAAGLDGNAYRYRDNTGLEVDVIIETIDGTWAAIEVKLGARAIARAEQNLLKLRDERVDTARAGAPAFLAVVTATQYAYTLASGVHVVPLGTLGP